MKFQELFASAKNGEFKNVYLFHGEEEFVKEEALHALCRSAVPEMAELNVVTLSNPTLDELLLNCDTIPFLGERRVVICNALYKEKDAKALLKYLDIIPKETILVFYITGKADSKGMIVKHLRQINADVDFSIFPETDAAKWIMQHARSAGVNIDPPTALYMVTLVGRDIRSLKNELSKLTVYVGDGGTITKPTIVNIVIQNQEFQLYSMYAFFMNGKFKDGFHALESIISGKNIDEEAIGIAGYFTRCLKNTLVAFDALAANCPRQELESRLGMSGRTVGDICQNAKKFTRKKLLISLREFSNVSYMRISGSSSAIQALKDAILHTFCK